MERVTKGFRIRSRRKNKMYLQVHERHERCVKHGPHNVELPLESLNANRSDFNNYLDC